MRRKYLARYSDNHGIGMFTFHSEHRSNSKACLEDACAQARKNYGEKREKLIDILDIELIASK